MFWEPLKEDEMRRVIAFIENGDASVLDTDIPDRFTGLFFAFQKKLAKTSMETRRENARLRKYSDRVRAEKEDAAERGDFTDLAIDSTLVAQAVIWCVKRFGGTLSMKKLMFILYEVYASWLYHHSQRIFLDHPEAQESGPWFWKVAKTVGSIQNGAGKERFDALHAENAGVAEVVWNICRNYAQTDDDAMQKYLAKTKPVQMCRRENNAGKWNKKYSDAEIYRWKKMQKGK